MSSKLLKQRQAKPVARGPASPRETPLEVQEMLQVPRDRPSISVIPLDRISPNPDQPRSSFDDEELKSLAHSIDRYGLQQPIVVRSAGERDRWVIVMGERRYRAFRMLGKDAINAIVSVRGDPGELALIENTQRSDLNAVEVALALRRLVDLHGYTQDHLAQMVGKSVAHVSNLLGVLRLPRDILDEFVGSFGKSISQTKLIELSKIEDESAVREIWEMLKDGRTRSELREAIGQIQSRPAKGGTPGEAVPDPAGHRPSSQDGSALLRLGKLLARFDKDISTVRESRTLLDDEHRKRLRRLRDEIDALLQD